MIGKSPEDDRKRSLLDNMNRQIEEVCDQLARVPELADGFNAIGLSQGGQFLRAYVERCNRPRVKVDHSRITASRRHGTAGCVENESSRGALGIERRKAQAEALSTNEMSIPAHFRPKQSAREVYWTTENTFRSTVRPVPGPTKLQLVEAATEAGRLLPLRP